MSFLQLRSPYFKNKVITSNNILKYGSVPNNGSIKSIRSVVFAQVNKVGSVQAP